MRCIHQAPSSCHAPASLGCPCSWCNLVLFLLCSSTWFQLRVYRNNRGFCLTRPFENILRLSERGARREKYIDTFKAPYWELKRKKERSRSRLFWDSQVNGRAVLSTASLSKCFITLKFMSMEWRSEPASGSHLLSKMSKRAQSEDKQKEPNRSHFFLWRWQAASLLFLQLFLSNRSSHTQCPCWSFTANPTSYEKPAHPRLQLSAAVLGLLFIHAFTWTVLSKASFCFAHSYAAPTHDAEQGNSWCCLPSPPVGLVSLLKQKQTLKSFLK